jgi:hypothetical protein
MAQTLEQQAARRDDAASFGARVSAALDLEALDIVNRSGAWVGSADRWDFWARNYLTSSVARSDAQAAAVRMAAADLVARDGVNEPTDQQIRKSARRSVLFAIGAPQEP